MRKPVVAALLCAAAAPSFAPAVRAGEVDPPDAVVRLLPRARVSLAQGLRQAARGGEVPLSAKFEIDAGGNLSLSVYTAEKGFDADAEHAVLKEWSGSPEGEAWEPGAEVFADAPHVARAAQQFALLALAPVTLLSAVESLERSPGSAVISVTPVLRGRRALIVARTVKDGVVREASADLLSGTFLAPAPEAATVRVPVKRHESVRRGEWAVEFGCAGVGDGNGFVYFRILESPRAVEKVLVVNARGETLLAPEPRPGRGGFFEVAAGREFGEPTELWIFPRGR